LCDLTLNTDFPRLVSRAAVRALSFTRLPLHHLLIHPQRLIIPKRKHSKLLYYISLRLVVKAGIGVNEFGPNIISPIISSWDNQENKIDHQRLLCLAGFAVNLDIEKSVGRTRDKINRGLSFPSVPLCPFSPTSF
jgi:hypothetical protein